MGPPAIIPPGQWWSYRRNALVPLSLGWRTKSFGLETALTPAGELELLAVDVESPEARVLRVQYEGAEWEGQNFQGIRLTLLNNVDAAKSKQRHLVPWQGLQLQLPAGTARILLARAAGFIGDTGNPSDTIVNVTVSQSATALNFRQSEPTATGGQADDGWWEIAPLGTQRLLPPPFAVGAIITVYDNAAGTAPSGLFTGPFGAVAIVIALGQSVDLPIPLPGYIDAANPSAVVNLLFTVQWKVSN